MSWTLTKKLDVSAGPGEMKRREEVLNFQDSPEEIKSREAERGLRAGLLSLQLFPNGGATDIVFVTLFCIAVGTAIAWYTSCCTMARGHCLNIFVVLAAVHGLLGHRGWSGRSGLHSFTHPPPVPVPNKPPRFCGRKSKCLGCGI